MLDLGPDGGDGGGHIVAAGTPEQVAGVAESYTGQYLKSIVRPETARAISARRKTGQVAEGCTQLFFEDTGKRRHSGRRQYPTDKYVKPQIPFKELAAEGR